MIEDGHARAFVLQMEAGRLHGFVVRRGNAAFGYVDRCPHMQLPLATSLDDYLAPDRDLIVCSWHGALFEVETGRCVGGPCAGARLISWPIDVVEGEMVTAR
ncbi:MAG: Rieske (2Fe-2S) domain protein [Sphingomonas bacterium]|nr:Rieske (2Fe-2S) domain protein [Sphingomonas bacterium]